MSYFGLNKKAYIQLHISVFLWGFTAVLGKLISLSSMELVWWRMLFAFLSLVFIGKTISALRQMPPGKKGIVFLSGGLLALHWVLFYTSIKMANPTIALVGLATTSFFTAILEPLSSGKKIVRADVLIGFMAVPGMILIYQNVDFKMAMGLWVAIGSAIVLAVYSIVSKNQIRHNNALSMSMLHMLGGWFFISLAMVLLPGYSLPRHLPSGIDLLYLLIMAIFCTTIPFILSLQALRKLSAFASNLTLNLEPVYGILLAWLLLDDAKAITPGFIIGVSIVLLSVLSYPLLYPYLHKE